MTPATTRDGQEVWSESWEGTGLPARVVFDFIEHFPEAQKANAPATHLMPLTCGKVRKPAILQHPGAPGDPLTSLRYRAVQLPRPEVGKRLS